MIGMINIEKSLILEARYQPMNPPTFKLFHNAVPISYLNKLNVDTLTNWLIKKVASPTKLLKSHSELLKVIS